MGLHKKTPGVLKSPGKVKNTQGMKNKAFGGKPLHHAVLYGAWIRLSMPLNFFLRVLCRLADLPFLLLLDRSFRNSTILHGQ